MIKKSTIWYVKLKKVNFLLFTINLKPSFNHYLISLCRIRIYFSRNDKTIRLSINAWIILKVMINSINLNTRLRYESILFGNHESYKGCVMCISLSILFFVCFLIIFRNGGLYSFLIFQVFVKIIWFNCKSLVYMKVW